MIDDPTTATAHARATAASAEHLLLGGSEAPSEYELRYAHAVAACSLAWSAIATNEKATP